MNLTPKHYKLQSTNNLALRVILFLILLIPFNLLANSNNGLKPILIVSSYNPETLSTVRNIEEFRRVCDSLGIKNEFNIENLNCKNLDEVKFIKERFYEYTKKYIVKGKLDVSAIVLLGQEAWSAFISQDNPIYNNIPIIVNLISSNGVYLPHKDSTLSTWEPEYFEITNILRDNLIFSTTYHYDIESNLDLIAELTPYVKNVAFISDNTFGGAVMKALVKDKFSKQNRFDLTLIDGSTMNIDAVAKKINELNDSTAILIGSWRIDKDGTYFLSSNITQILPKDKNLPVYTLSTIGMGNAALAGIMPDYRNQGRDIAINLRDAFLEEYYDRGINNKYIGNIKQFDVIKAEELEIDKSLLKGGILINKHKGLLSKYPNLFNYILFILCALILYIIFISFHLLKTKKLIHSIRVSEHNNKLILNNIGIGLLYVNKDREVVWENCSINPDMQAWSFYKMGHKCNKYKPTEFLSECAACPVNNQHKGIATQISNLKVERDGKLYSISLIPTLDPDTQKYAGTIIRIEDITISEKANEQLKLAKDKAENADKLKSLFLANMSHEIRTPLNAIVGFSELMVNCDERDERYEYSKIINANNKLLLQLITDILDLSKIEAGTLEFNIKNINLNNITEDCFHVFYQQCAEKGIDLRLNIPNSELLVNSDPLRLSQVISNFLTNALKFTEKGYIEIGYIVENDFVKIYVRDSGIGISDDKLEVIFHRFVKLNSFAQGVGLGLSICAMIANKLNGTIGVDSKINEGSTFWIRIPINKFH